MQFVSVAYLASGLKISWLLCVVFLEQNLYCNVRLLWQMLSRPQPSCTRTICEKQRGRNDFFKLISKAFSPKGFDDTCVCTSESVLFCWRRLRTGVMSDGPALVRLVWPELHRDTLTLTGILSSLSLISRWNRRIVFIGLIWCLTVLYKWMLLSETVLSVGVGCQCRFLSSVHAAPVFLRMNSETPLLVFFSQRRPQRRNWALRGEKSTDTNPDTSRCITNTLNVSFLFPNIKKVWKLLLENTPSLRLSDAGCVV